MFSNEVEENMSLEENHRLVNESLTKFTTYLISTVLTIIL